ncbi:hypothetical protein D3C71_1759440 [compost metagenome]
MGFHRLVQYDFAIRINSRNGELFIGELALAAGQIVGRTGMRGIRIRRHRQKKFVLRQTVGQSGAVLLLDDELSRVDGSRFGGQSA